MILSLVLQIRSEQNSKIFIVIVWFLDEILSNITYFGTEKHISYGFVSNTVWMWKFYDNYIFILDWSSLRKHTDNGRKSGQPIADMKPSFIPIFFKVELL